LGKKSITTKNLRPWEPGLYLHEKKKRFLHKSKLGNDSMSDPFIIEVSDKEIQRERQKARALRKTRWWHQRLSKGSCFYCGQQFPPSHLSMDHVVPLIRGGKTTKGNVVPVCKACNYRKKYLLPMEWEEYRRGNLKKSSG
jgi:5-methylcytosine-specific restriction endonuclease McrA